MRTYLMRSSFIFLRAAHWSLVRRTASSFLMRASLAASSSLSLPTAAVSTAGAAVLGEADSRRS